ncbi:MAG: hypothetical protein J3Q66DRAFT_398717 [Benniella sp.]|nr:MAG: hypothetical protein J3Q66DRAFT_398717 [Benniella sp.]
MSNKRESSKPIESDRAARRQRLQEGKRSCGGLTLEPAFAGSVPDSAQQGPSQYRGPCFSDADGTGAFIRAAHPFVKPSKVAEGWETLKAFFSDDNQERHVKVTGLVNVSGWIAAFKRTPTPDAQRAVTISIPPPPSPPAMTPDHSTSSPSPDSGQVQDPPINRNRDSVTYTETDSSNNSNGSSNTLLPIQILKTKDELKKATIDRAEERLQQESKGARGAVLPKKGGVPLAHLWPRNHPMTLSASSLNASIQLLKVYRGKRMALP